jgi:hypothetical protein
MVIGMELRSMSALWRGGDLRLSTLSTSGECYFPWHVTTPPNASVSYKIAASPEAMSEKKTAGSVPIGARSSRSSSVLPAA